LNAQTFDDFISSFDQSDKNCTDTNPNGFTTLEELPEEYETERENILECSDSAMIGMTGGNTSFRTFYKLEIRYIVLLRQKKFKAN